MAFNINSFRGSFTSGEVANPTNYEVFITRKPNVLQNTSSEFDRTAQFRCETCSLPSKSMKFTERVTYGASRKIAYASQYDDVSFSFIATDSMSEKEYFALWQKYIVDNDSDSGLENTNSVTYYDDYIGEIRIAFYDKSGKNSYEVILKEAYPIAVQETPLSWNSNNEYVRITVNIAYRSFIERKL